MVNLGSRTLFLVSSRVCNGDQLGTYCLLIPETKEGAFSLSFSANLDSLTVLEKSSIAATDIGIVCEGFFGL